MDGVRERLLCPQDRPLIAPSFSAVRERTPEWALGKEILT